MSRKARERAKFVRFLACALLALIGADLVDANCDPPLTLSGDSSAILQASTAPDGRDEPCTDFCVPDCFCCSRSVAAAPAIVPPPPVLLTTVESPVHERRPEGVRPVADRPPLLLA